MTVSAAVNAYTANYSFRLINFNYPRWHTEEWANWQALDGVLRSLGATQIKGIWANATVYVVGDRVVDEGTGLIWICRVGHTSDATDTFAVERSTNPTYWEAFTSVPNYRGAWVTATAYSIGDIVVVNGGTWYFCTVAHTAAASFATDAAKWETIFDITTFTNYYYGGRSTETNLRPDGTASQAGDTYYNSTSNLLRLYNGTAWVNYNTAGTAASGITFTPTGTIVSTNVQSAISELEGDVVTLSASAVPAARLISAGAGLTGGGSLAADRTISIANLGVTTAMLADLSVTAGKIANDTITAAQIAANAVGASELADNSVDTAAIVNDAVNLDKLLNATVNQRVLGRNTAGAGNFEEVTVNQILDWLSTTRGVILYRGAASWAVLSPGTAGQVVGSNGAGADPSYQSVVTSAVAGTGITVSGATGAVTFSASPTRATAQNTTSGTSIDFTSIPSGVKRITIVLDAVSTNGASVPLVQIGDSGGIETTGYDSVSSITGTGAATVVATTGYNIYSSSSVYNISGTVTLHNVSGNIWVASVCVGLGSSVACAYGGGTKTLSGTLDRVRLTTTNGTDTFDSGSITIMYE